jgi:hypothetical protein
MKLAPVVASVIAPLVLACSAADSGAAPDAGPIALTSENNYRTTASLSLPTVVTGSGVDLDICWPNLTTDMQCHAVAPQADIDNVAFLRLLHVTAEQAQLKLVSGDISQSEIDGYVEFHTENQGTCAKLSQFSFMGTKVDVLAEYQESADETYLLLFSHGLQRGIGARGMMFLKPTAASTNTKVDAVPACGALTFAADLSSVVKVPVKPTGPWIVDWRGVKKDGQGGEVIYSTLDKLLIGYYQGKTVKDIEAKFFDLELMATSLWDLALTGGYTADLSQAVKRNTQEPFTGFTAPDGLWLLGLTCSTCQNPAPVILTVLDPSGGGK